MSGPLEFTGERFTPECVREIWYEHFHRYVLARELIANLDVLDAACGEGYGSALLSGPAASVTGVDVSASAIEHAQDRYASGSLEFQVADCLDLPFDDDRFDCIISFETLEHLEDHDRLMQAFRRVLKPGGFLVVSTPDKAVYTDRQKNDNEYHVRELYRGEFEDLLGRYFPAYRLLGQKLMFQSAIWSLGNAGGVKFHQEEEGKVGSFNVPHHDPVYLIAICAADESSLPPQVAGLSLFDDAAESVYQHYNDEIGKHIAAGELLAEQEKTLEALKARLESTTPPPRWWNRWFGKS